MRIDELPRSDRIEDRRGGGSAGFPTGRTGGLGLGTIAILFVVGWALGINPLDLIGVLTGQNGSPEQSAPAPPSRTETPSDQMGQFTSAVLGSTEVQWKEIFAQAGKTYEPPTLVMFSGATRSGCGFAQAAMGPFYCPVDRKVYLDTSFFEDLQRRLLPQVQEAQRGMDQVEANHLQVRVELQADCFAGIWAHRAEEKWRIMEPGDVEAAIQTASAIGDDRLQRRSQGYVVPDAFTHGSSEQRTRWLMTGLKSGQLASCDTFQSARF